MDDPRQSSAKNPMVLDIYLFSNGEKSSPPRKHHLDSEQLVSLEATLSYLARQQYSSTHTCIQLHTLDGQVVKTHEELLDGAAYVAVPLQTSFVQSGYNQYLAKASRSREKRLARRISTELDNSGASKDVHTDDGTIKNPTGNNVVVNRLETSVKANISQRPNLIQPCWKPTGARTAGLKPVANQVNRFPGIGRKLGSSPAELSAHKAVLNKREPFTPYTRNGVRLPRLSHEDRSMSSEGRNSRAKPEVILAEKICTQNSKLASSNVKPTKNSTNKLKPILKPLTGKLVINDEESKNCDVSTSITNRQGFNTNRVSRPTDTNSDGHETEETIKKISDTIPEENYDINSTKKEAPIPFPQYTDISTNEIKKLTMSSTKDMETIIHNDKFTRFKAVVTEVSSKFVPDTYINNVNIVDIVKNERKKSQGISTKSSNNISDGQSNTTIDQNNLNVKGNDSEPNISSQTGESETSNNVFHRKSVEDQAKGLILVQNKHKKPFNDYFDVDSKYSRENQHKKTQNENVNSSNYIKPEKLDFKSKFKALEKHSESLYASQKKDDSKRPSEENWTVKFLNKDNHSSPTPTSPKPSDIDSLTHAVLPITDKLLNYSVVDNLESNDEEAVTRVSDPNKDLKKYENSSKISKENSMFEHKRPISSLSSRRPSSKIIAEDMVCTLLTLFMSGTDNVTSGITKTSSEMNKSKADFVTTYESSKSYHAFNKINDTKDTKDIDEKIYYINATHNMHSDERITRDSAHKLPKFSKLPPNTSHIVHNSSNKFIAFLHKGEQVNLQINISVRNSSDTKVVETNEANPNTDMKTNEKSYTTHVSIDNSSSNLGDSAVYPHICCETSNKMTINKCPCCHWIAPGDSNVPEVIHSLNGDLQPYYILRPGMAPTFLSKGRKKPDSSDTQVENTESPLKVAISAHELERISEKEPEPKGVSTVRDKNVTQSETLIVESGLTQTSSALLIKEDTEGASTQTDWSNVLLQAKLHEDGHYSFHLPPLSLLRKYNL